MNVSYPVADGIQEKLAEAIKDLPLSWLESTNTIHHGPYSFPIEGVGQGAIGIYELDDSKTVEVWTA